MIGEKWLENGRGKVIPVNKGGAGPPLSTGVNSITVDNVEP